MYDVPHVIPSKTTKRHIVIPQVTPEQKHTVTPETRYGETSWGISSFCLAFSFWMWNHIILGHVGCQTFWNHDILTPNAHTHTHTHCTGCQDVEQPPATLTPPQPIWGFQAKWSFWDTFIFHHFHICSKEIQPLLSANQLLPKLRNCIGPWGRSITWILLQVVPHPLWPYEKMISPSVCDVFIYIYSIDIGVGGEGVRKTVREIILFCVCLVFFWHSVSDYCLERKGLGRRLGIYLWSLLCLQ